MPLAHDWGGLNIVPLAAKSALKREMPPVPFWRWSNWHRIGSSGEDLRTVFEFKERAPYEILDRVNCGFGPVDATSMPAFTGNLEFTATPEDCPWPVSEMFIVSDRVRKILESAAPGNCQFLPMELWHNDRRSDLVYWVLYVHAVDCADLEKSGRTHNRAMCDPVIIDERVPSHVQVLRVWDPVHRSSSSGIFVRDHLRRVLVKEKVTGCFFFMPPVPIPEPPDE